MIIHLQYGNVAFTRRYLISSYLPHSVLNGEFDYQVVSWCYSLPRVKGRPTQDGVVSKQTIDNQEQDIFGDLLRVITNCYNQSNRAKVVYTRSSESNERCGGWNQPFSLNPHLLERQVIEDINRSPIVHKDLWVL